ncbi:MAG: hypothetical protein Q8K67_02625 [Geothrix sp.]|nr:hypothetical protein [Geothrix sp.]
MRSPVLMLLPAALVAQGPRTLSPADLFERELKKNRLGTWLVLEDEGATWGTAARAALQEDPLVALNLPLQVAGGKKADAMSSYLRDRYGWARGGHWALVDSGGRVLAEGASLPSATVLGAAAERAGLKTRAQELADFLRRNGDHLEAQAALLHERILIACRRTRKTLGVVEEKPKTVEEKPKTDADAGKVQEPVQLDVENDLKIWAEVAQALDRLFQGPWLEVSSDLPWALNGAEAVHSPTMRALWARHLPAIEDALRRQPNAWDLWRVWILGADLAGGRPLSPLLDSLEPLPGTAPEDWPPAAVLEAFVRDAKKRGDWRAIREAMEPRWEEWRRDTRRSAMGQGPGERIWSRVLQPLIEALLALGDAGSADQVVLQAMEALRWDGLAGQARDLALRLNRPDLAVRWGGMSQARPR